MTEELRARGFSAGHRRVGRLMRENDIRVVRTQRFKVTTKSAYSYAIEPNLLRQDFSAIAPNQNGQRTSHTVRLAPGGPGERMTGMQRRKEEQKYCLVPCCGGT